jgi:Nickel responsive protein SCO4226-like
LLPEGLPPTFGSVKKFMVERYLPGMTAREVDEASARLAATAEALAAEGIGLRYGGSTYLPEEQSCFCRFEASSREVVEDVCNRTRVPFARIHAVRSFPRGKEHTCTGE